MFWYLSAALAAPAVPKLELPRPAWSLDLYQICLPSGLLVDIVRRPEAGVVAVTTVVGGGTAAETDATRGAAHLRPPRGTRRRPPAPRSSRRRPLCGGPTCTWAGACRRRAPAELPPWKPAVPRLRPVAGTLENGLTVWSLQRTDAPYIARASLIADGGWATSPVPGASEVLEAVEYPTFPTPWVDVRNRVPHDLAYAYRSSTTEVHLRGPADSLDVALWAQHHLTTMSLDMESRQSILDNQLLPWLPMLGSVAGLTTDALRVDHLLPLDRASRPWWDRTSAARLVTVGLPLAANGNTLVLEVPDTLPSVRADRVRVRQILVNLLSNAAKFTSHGTITVTAEVRAEVRIAARDMGIGIPADQLPRLFEAFTRVDESSTRRHGGTGLGLAISQELARLHGGRITVESVAGAGSTFTLVLPRT